MSQTIAISVKSIKHGPIPNDYSMGTVLSVIGNTYKDSASFKENKATVFNVQVEETDDPIYQFFTKSPKTLAFGLVDYSPATIQAVKGGTVNNGVWGEPDVAVKIEEAYQVITQTGLLIEIPRGSVTAAFNADLKKSAVALLDVEVTPLKPLDPTVPAINISKYEPPVVTIPAAANPVTTAALNAVTATATAYRGTITTQAWALVSKPTGAADPVISAPAALTTNFTGLVDGSYTFALTVTDENEFSTTQMFTFTVALS